MSLVDKVNNSIVLHKSQTDQINFQVRKGQICCLSLQLDPSSTVLVQVINPYMTSLFSLDEINLNTNLNKE